MNTQTKLRDSMREARVDVSLRSRLLENARFSKKCWGWLTLFWGLLIVLDLVGVRLGFLTSYSISVWMSAVLAVLLYDKFGDRVAMLESLEEEMPNQPAQTTPGLRPSVSDL